MALNFIDKAIEIFMLMRRSCTCYLMNILIVHKSMTFYEELKMKPVDYIDKITRSNLQYCFIVLMASRNLSCKESIALYHNLQSRMFVVCTVKYVYKNIHTKCVLFPRNLWIRNFVSMLCLKKVLFLWLGCLRPPFVIHQSVIIHILML